MADIPYLIEFPRRFRSIARVGLCATVSVQLMLVTAEDSGAQGAAASGTGVLTGVVTTEDAVPLRLARVSISGTALTVVTESDGTFRLTAVPAGVQTIEVKLLGFSALSVPIEVFGGESLHIKLPLSTNPVTLGTVEVRADSARMTPMMKGFQARRARGDGTFFTREEIVAMQPRQVTDVLRRVVGLRIESYGNGGIVQLGRNNGGMGMRICPVVFYINGTPFPVAENSSINTYISAEEVEGVEVYSGAARIPQQFNSGMYNTRCGVIAIWTRSGPEVRPPRHGSTHPSKPNR